jgi:hypothetical protein
LAKRQALALPSTTNIRVTGSPLAAPAAMLDDAPPSLADDINNTPLAARPKLEGDSAAPQMHSATSPSSALSTLAAFPSESISIQQRNEYRSTSSLQAPSSFDYAHVDAGFVNMSELEAESARV